MASRIVVHTDDPCQSPMAAHLTPGQALEMLNHLAEVDTGALDEGYVAVNWRLSMPWADEAAGLRSTCQ